MTRIFISVEGAAEQAIIDILINNYELFESDDVDVKVIRGRSARRIEEEIGLDHGGAQIILIRILDSPKEQLKLRKDFTDKVTIENYYTKPEIEILYIIAEGKYEHYTNKSSKIKASEYVKSVLKIKNCKSYENTLEYFSEKDLIEILKKYNSLKKKREECLYDFYLKYMQN